MWGIFHTAWFDFRGICNRFICASAAGSVRESSCLGDKYLFAMPPLCGAEPSRQGYLAGQGKTLDALDNGPRRDRERSVAKLAHFD
jgi:hypothetical protein